MENLTDQEYRQRQRELRAIGGSDLGAINESLAHWQARKGRDPSDAMLRGTAIHCAVLEPERFDLEYSHAKAVYKDEEAFAAAKEAGQTPAGPWRVDGVDHWYKLRKDAKAAAGGGLSDSEWQIVTNSAEAVARHPIAGPLVAESVTERAIFWAAALAGVDVNCCAKVDAWHDGRGALVDLKTVNRTVGPARASKWIVDGNYHAQLAHYAAGLTASGQAVSEVLIVAVEALPPHAVAVYRLSDDLLELGQQRRLEALRRVAEWDPTAPTPAYSAEIYDVDAPRWAMTDEAREAGRRRRQQRDAMARMTQAQQRVQDLVDAIGEHVKAGDCSADAMVGFDLEYRDAVEDIATAIKELQR